MATAKTVLRIAAAVLYVAAGTSHFLHPGTYLKIMPEYIPWPLGMIDTSGAAEIAGGVGLLIPRLWRAAAWGLTALLIAIFPANLYMAMHDVQIFATPTPAWVLWARLPLQLVLIGWVLWCTAPAVSTPLRAD